ncbi:FHA domain-containing protein [Salininema proteolyticum]|uniref:FHA domain-containing protein n=1 Tax=Salininema proteolyticum TaxID=1607685 RepID=A0ABV8TV40_9ACTN
MSRANEEFPPPDVTATMDLADINQAGEGGADAQGPQPADSLPVGTALLVVKKGPNSGARFLLTNEVTSSGRHPDSDIFLDDVTVSRRHAEFHRDASGFTVRDMGSLNGTYVNRERVETATLGHGDEVQIGKFRLEFVGGPRPVPGQ